jgi:hypothetical protein
MPWNVRDWGNRSLMRLALAVLATALVAIVVNFLGATGGHCDDDGCSADFPEWLYLGLGWLVLLCLAALLLLAGYGAVRRLRR